MSSEISLELVTPHGLAFQQNVGEVLLPTPEGQLGILPKHASLITLISPGVISFRSHRDSGHAFEHFATEGGLAEIDRQRVRILADSAQRADDIDEAKARQALDEAKTLQATAKDRVTMADATRLIESNLARLKVARLKRKRVY